MLFESEKNEAACNAAKALVERMPRKIATRRRWCRTFLNQRLMDIDRVVFRFDERVQIDAAGRDVTKRS